MSAVPEPDLDSLTAPGLYDGPPLRLQPSINHEVVLLIGNTEGEMYFARDVARIAILAAEQADDPLTPADLEALCPQAVAEIRAATLREAMRPVAAEITELESIELTEYGEGRLSGLRLAAVVLNRLGAFAAERADDGGGR